MFSINGRFLAKTGRLGSSQFILRWLEIVFIFPRPVSQILCQIQFGLSYQCEIYHRNK